MKSFFEKSIKESYLSYERKEDLNEVRKLEHRPQKHKTITISYYEQCYTIDCIIEGKR